MVIGVLRFTLHTPESASLKAKRQATRGVLQRLGQRFPAAVAEVGGLDLWQITEAAAVVVSADAERVDGLLAAMIRHLEALSGDAVLTQVSTELVSM